MFQGVLIPDWQWKKLNEDLIEKDLLKTRVTEIEAKEVPKTNALEVFFWGFVVGSGAILLADKLKGH